jgi:hypothetical protein
VLVKEQLDQRIQDNRTISTDKIAFDRKFSGGDLVTK